MTQKTQKARMTIEEHAEYGRELKTLLAGRMFHADILNKFPKKSSQQQALWRAREALVELQSKMENAICALVPVDDPVWDWSKFYAGETDADPRRAW